MEQQLCNFLRVSRQRADTDGFGARVIQQHPGNQQAAGQHSRDPDQQRDMIAWCPLFFPGIEQHNDKDK